MNSIAKSLSRSNHTGLQLDEGSRVVVIGGGPAGSFFSYFLLTMAQRIGVSLQVDIFEPRDYTRPGPASCNMCGGVISESLVQALAVEGIKLPPTVVQRGLDSYFLHMDVGSVRIETPLQEKRIGAIHRGAGPRGLKETRWGSFDGYLLDLAIAKGARRLPQRVEEITWRDGRPHVKPQGGTPEPCDLLVAAVGVNSAALKLFSEMNLGYAPPETTKTYICEFFLGQDVVNRYLGSAMHVFLLNIPRLEFAALIPKGEYATFCLLGQEIDKPLVQALLDSPELRRCLPPNWRLPVDYCHCSPKISVSSAVHPVSDRIVFVGDCGTSRLYKDGIGAAYKTAKAAAKTALFAGVSADDFKRHFWPTCQTLRTDNRIGELVFAITRQIQKRTFARRGLWSMVSKEQQLDGGKRRMSTVLWDTFTGSAPYREVFARALHPAFLSRFAWEILRGSVPPHRHPAQARKT
jgi:flavin-dependent dehydrogenase